MQNETSTPENSFDLLGTTVIIISQLSFTCVGTLLNNFILVTLKTIPGEHVTLYHILLTNIMLVNIFTCTILKPARGVYLGYAYARGLDMVGLQFCHLHTFLSWVALPILPFSLVPLAWQGLLGGTKKLTRRSNKVRDEIAEEKRKRRISNVSTRKYNERNSRKLSTISEAVSIVLAEPSPQHAWSKCDTIHEVETTGPTVEETSGPRRNMILVVLAIWTAASLVGIESLEYMHTSTVHGEESDENKNNSDLQKSKGYANR